MKKLIACALFLVFAGCEDKNVDWRIFAPGQRFDRWVGQGYDECGMFNDIIWVSLDRKIIEPKDVKKINAACDEQHRSDPEFCFIDYAAEYLRILVRNKIITKDKYYEIVNNAKSSGGVLVGGYNPLIFCIDILEILLDKKAITKEEGQRIIDGNSLNDFN